MYIYTNIVVQMTSVLYSSSVKNVRKHYMAVFFPAFSLADWRTYFQHFHMRTGNVDFVVFCRCTLYFVKLASIILTHT